VDCDAVEKLVRVEDNRRRSLGSRTAAAAAIVATATPTKSSQGAAIRDVDAGAELLMMGLALDSVARRKAGERINIFAPVLIILS
jgi:hypothetical protein